MEKGDYVCIIDKQNSETDYETGFIKENEITLEKLHIDKAVDIKDSLFLFY